MRKKAVVCFGAGMLACIFSSVAADVPLFPGGDFESGGEGWNLPSPFWKIKKGLGLNKSSALSLVVRKGQKIKWPESGFFDVEGGLAYRLEGWQKTDEFKIARRKGDPKLYFMVYDAAGKKLGCFGGASRVVDNSVRNDGWYRVEGDTRILPAEAVKARLHIWSYDGVGNAQFDNIVVRPMVVNPVDQLCCSAYRNEAWEGKVAFSTAYSVNPLKNPDGALECELEYTGAKGVERAAGVLSGGIATVKLPVESFAFGRNEVRLTVRRRDGTKVLGSSSCSFTRESAPMPRKVTFDSRHRTIVDGKPFFPLGMYWGDVTAEDIATYTNGPFNCLMPYKRPDERKLDICHAAGVKVIYPISGMFIELAKAKTPQQAAAINSKSIRGRIRRYRMHPAVLAWYLADEMPLKYEPMLTARRTMVHEMDPDHPTWIVLDKPADVRPLINGFDVIGTDPYPIGNHGDENRTAIGLAAGWARQAKKATYGFKPMWQVPQAFDWGCYRTSETNRTEVRMPNYDELRSMTWQAIAAGANGLVYYSFSALHKGKDWQKARTAGGWENLCKVAREVKAYESVILSDGEIPRIEGVQDDVAARAWRHEGRVHLLLANTKRKKVSGTAVVDGKRKCPFSLEPIGVSFIDMAE